MKTDKTTHYKGISRIYFSSIIFNIIKIGNLDKTNQVILDFGCGEKQLSKHLISKKVLNYDINPIYIPRNHQIEKAIRQSYAGDDQLFHQFPGLS